MFAVVLYIVIMSLGWIIITKYKSVANGHLEVSSLDGEVTGRGVLWRWSHVSTHGSSHWSSLCRDGVWWW